MFLQNLKLKLNTLFRRDSYYYSRKGRKCLTTNPRKALTFFEKSVQLGPNDGMLHYNIAECLTRESTNHPDLRNPAMEYLNKTIGVLERSDPFWDAAHLMRGNVSVRLGMMQEALADYNKAAEKRPNNPEVYYRRGVAFWKSGNRQKAEDDLSKALSLGQGSPFSTLIEAALAQLKRGGEPPI